jgi:hypothetical protein
MARGSQLLRFSGPFGEWPVLADCLPWEDAHAALDAAGLGDGLPLVPPTQARLEAMLAGAGIADPERSLGTMPPLFGELTLGAIAYCSVISGCRPAELAVVATAAEACLEPDFNLLGLATTTGSAAVGLIVLGPAARALGLNGAGNCLGPGNRANACIGRALSLVLRNVGGARAPDGDMATMGQPGKYTFCFAEGEATSTGRTAYPPLHVRRGLRAEESAITVLGVSGTAEVLPDGAPDSVEAILAPVAAVMVAAHRAGGAAKASPLEQVVLLPPELAAALAERDCDLSHAQAWLYERTSRLSGSGAPRPIAPGPTAVHLILAGGPGVKITHLPLWGGGTRLVTRPIG